MPRHFIHPVFASTGFLGVFSSLVLFIHWFPSQKMLNPMLDDMEKRVAVSSEILDRINKWDFMSLSLVSHWAQGSANDRHTLSHWHWHDNCGKVTAHHKLKSGNHSMVQSWKIPLPPTPPHPPNPLPIPLPLPVIMSSWCMLYWSHKTFSNHCDSCN